MVLPLDVVPGSAFVCLSPFEIINWLVTFASAVEHAALKIAVAYLTVLHFWRAVTEFTKKDRPHDPADLLRSMEDPQARLRSLEKTLRPRPSERKNRARKANQHTRGSRSTRARTTNGPHVRQPEGTESTRRRRAAQTKKKSVVGKDAETQFLGSAWVNERG